MGLDGKSLAQWQASKYSLRGPSERLQFLDRESVALHNTPQDAWVIIFQKVYDITEFLAYHPGGADILLPKLGQDCTADFGTRYLCL